MKKIVFLYAGFTSRNPFAKDFSGQSAFDRVLLWAQDIDDCAGTVVLTFPEFESEIKELLKSSSVSEGKVITQEKWTVENLLEKLAVVTSESGADAAVYAFADCPFLSKELTQEILDSHKKYVAEYTFQDGYPFGFAPEVIDKGTLNILSSMCKNQIAQGKIPSEELIVKHDSIFNIIKVDINSFDLEAVMSEKDYRLLRLDFSCDKKENFLASKNLFNKALDTKTLFTPKDLSDLAEKTVEVQKTVPAYYSVQISGKCSSWPVYSPLSKEHEKDEVMSLEKFNAFVQNAADFSDNAFISLGGWGEPLLIENIASYVSSVLSHDGLSVLIETDGLCLSEKNLMEVKDVVEKASERKNGNPKILWIVSIDAFTEKKYLELRSVDDSVCKGLSPFVKAVDSVSVLEKNFPGCAYPQFTRMNENEDELEGFFRYWNEKTNPSGGKLIVQKYSTFCGLLPPRKSADLSPLERNPCWHLKRDLTVLVDGNVPLCRERFFSDIQGNVFEDGIEKIWEKITSVAQEHINLKYSQQCRNCDEYYTFNF